MTPSLMACRILKSAEEELEMVIQALVGCDPEQLAGAQLLLEKMVHSLGDVEAAARSHRSLPVEKSLTHLRTRLARAEILTGFALGCVENQRSLAGALFPVHTQSLSLEA